MPHRLTLQQARKRLFPDDPELAKRFFPDPEVQARDGLRFYRKLQCDSVEHIIGKIERKALQIFRRHGGQTDWSDGSGKWELFHLPDRAANEAKISARILSECHHLKIKRDIPSPGFEKLTCLRIGQLIGEDRLNAYAPFIESGVKAKTRGHNWHVATYGTAEERRQKYDYWQSEIERMMKGNSHLSHRSAMMELQRKGEGSYETIRKHTTNPKKK